MPSIIYSLGLLLLINFFIEPTTCEIPTFLQNLELDDITSLVDKFPSVISKIKEAVNRFRCPKGWRRLGGSCYFLSEIRSTPTDANNTCSFLHSNHSNLMQIRNVMQLLYAAHALTKNNLSSLMIELDPNSLKGKSVTDILMDDKGQWQRMKEKFREMRSRYYKLKAKILEELSSAGLRISRRSKKIKQSTNKYKEKYIYNPSHSDMDYGDEYYDEHNITNFIHSNNTTTIIDEYEYDDIDSEDQSDEFERIDDIRGICDQVDWNVLNNDTTVYILTTFLLSDKIHCSISNVESNIEYDHVCEYVLDFCFANVICGKYGRCVNTLSGFKCSCSFLYGGLLCEKISKQGRQILISFGIVVFLYSLSIKPVRWTLQAILKILCRCCKGCCNQQKKKKKKKQDKTNEDKQQLVPTKKKDENVDDEELQQQASMDEPRPSIAEEILDFLIPSTPDPLKNPTKRDLSRTMWVSVLIIIFLSLLYSITTLTHFSSFKYEITDETKLDVIVNETIRLVAHCERISDSRLGNLIFFPIAVGLIIIFSWSTKRERKCLNTCDGRPGLIPPIEPFRTSNRFTTATIFGILSFEVLKIFEELLFRAADPFNHGVLVELIERIAIVVLVGLRYYPVLASLQLRNVVSRLLICLYVLGDIIFAIVREGSCMGFLPLSRYYSSIEEAKLRMELGTWFIVYGLIKTTPHFIFLSYIGAELCVRFAYDSIYVPLKKNQSIWSAPVVQQDEYEFAKYYVAKLFRQNFEQKQKRFEKFRIINKLDQQIPTTKTKKKIYPSRVKNFFNSIYHWDENFRFTTIATCTYTVAIVFLYYLACTFVFLYISRTTGHTLFLRYYIQSMINIEIKGLFSLRLEIITSAVIAFIIYAFQLFLGIQNYKKHKLDLFKGIYEDVPSPANFRPNAIVSKSVHYSGFLVGYMAWGFLICFHLIFLFLSFIRFITFQMRYFELVLAITVPVTVVYLLKMVTASSAGKFLFMQSDYEKINIDNRKTYAIFVYFNFFADCFLGVASCIIRLIKATFLNLVYMARLDYSFLGRPIEKFDLGYAAYVSYLHMEVTHTHPVMLAFCYSLYDDVVKRRPKHCYDDECCIAPGELDDDDSTIEQNIKIIKDTSPKTTKQNINGSTSKKAKFQRQESVSSNKSIKKKQSTISTTDDNDQRGSSIREVKPKTKSPSPSSVSDKSSQKSKTRKSSSKDDIQKEEDHDDASHTPTISTITRIIPEKQPRLPLPSAPFPDVPIREDLPVEEQENENNFDDDGGIKPPSISTISEVIPKQAPRLLPLHRTSPPRVPKREDDTEDNFDDDGGIKPPSISTISKVIPKQAPRLMPLQRTSPPRVPKREDDTEDYFDDDGGIKPPSISTISKVIPKQAPRLMPLQGKSPPRVPKREDIIDDDDDDDDNDDGGINPQIIAKQKRELEEKKRKKEEAKKKKEEAKKKKQLISRDDDDDDGGISRTKTSTKVKPKKKVVKPKYFDDDEDDDGGVAKQKQIAAEKKKQAIEAKKKKEAQRKALADKDNDEDDDGAPKRQQPIKKKTTTKKISKSDISKDDNFDDDGGRIVKTYDTVRTIIPTKKPVLDNQRKKQASPEAADDGSMLGSRHQQQSQQQQQRLLASYDTVGRIVPKVSTGFGRITEESHYDTIPTDEERATRANVIYSAPSYNQTSYSNDIPLLRTISYREAQQSATPPIAQRRLVGSSSRSQSNTNEDSSHYSEITTDTAQSGFINRSYSHTGSTKSSSNYSIKQPSKHSSEYTLKEQQTEESNVESEQEDEEKETEEEAEEEVEEEEDDQEEDEEEEEEEKQEHEEETQDKSSRKKRKPIPNVSTAYPFISHLVKPTEAGEILKNLKRKQARFRWHLAYTIINNYHLFDLRKQAESRLALLRIQRSNLIDEQQHAAVVAAVVTAAARVEEPVELDEIPQSIVMRGGEMKPKVSLRKRGALPEQQPQRDAHRLLSVPTPLPIIDEFPQSPAERYIAIRSCMLYDVNVQQPNVPQSANVYPMPPTTGQQGGVSRKLGSRQPPNIVIQSPSVTTDEPKSTRPLYQRQKSQGATPIGINTFNNTPLFQGLPDSGQSSTDALVNNYTTLHTQMSHAQHMQAWRQIQLKKQQKKRPYRYVYGTPPQRPLEEKVSTAAILTPQIIPINGKFKRLPSQPAFQFPRQVKNIDEKMKKTHERQISPTSSSQNGENNRDKSINKKPLKTTVSVIRRKDSPSSLSNITEV
ncbi:unnamed protein product [Rotaria sp. Silwood1]|nr:unnamed protein product [Rotaria sp. Silwood1]CAF1302730.1 unnamed protein product [Rotaria sp. Silwood1]